MQETPNSGSKEQAPLFGIRPLIEAIEAGKTIDRIFMQRGLRGENVKELLQLLREHGLHYQQVPVEKLNRLTQKNHQGIVAFMTHVEYQPLEAVLPAVYERGEEPLLVLLDRVTDVRNFGAIARSAECLGGHAVIVPQRGMAPANGDAVKSSAGALLRLPICREANLKSSLQFLKDSGVKLVAVTEKGSRSLYDAPLNGPICLLMGSEEDGISGEYLKMADEQVYIPMSGHTASLNVSVSAGILLAEVQRQRQLQP